MQPVIVAAAGGHTLSARCPEATAIFGTLVQTATCLWSTEHCWDQFCWYPVCVTLKYIVLRPLELNKLHCCYWNRYESGADDSQPVVALMLQLPSFIRVSAIELL